jgi:hypothetical protein
MKKILWKFEQVQQAKNWQEDCNEVNFINSGNVAVTVNNFSILPGSTLVLRSQPGEIDNTVYKIIFNGSQQGRIDIIYKVNA